MADDKVVQFIKQGKREPTLLALRTNQPIEIVEAQVLSATTPVEPIDILKQELTEALEMLNLSKVAYQSDQSADNSTAYTQILREVKTLIKQIEAYKDPAQVADEIAEMVRDLSSDFIQLYFGALHELKPFLTTARKSEINRSITKMAVYAERRYNTAIRSIRKALGATGDSLPDVDIDAIKRGLDG